jgi:hypothetical protein
MLQMVINKRLKGNTLPEVLVAITITTFCSTLAVIIYLNIQQSTRPLIRLKGAELTEKYLKQSLQERSYFDRVFSDEGFTIKQTVSRNEQFRDCLNLNIIAFDTDQKKIAELKTLVRAE